MKWCFQSGRLVRVLAAGGLVTAVATGALLVFRPSSSPAKDEPVALSVRKEEEQKPILSDTHASSAPRTGVVEVIPHGRKPYGFTFRSQHVPAFPEDFFDLGGLPKLHYPSPAHVTRVKYDEATRTLHFDLRLYAPEAELGPAREQLARLYALSNRPNVEARDVVLCPLPLLGIQIRLRAAGRVVLLRSREPIHDRTVLPGTVQLEYTVPAGDEVLHERLRSSPEDASVEVQTFHDFREIETSHAIVQLLRSAAEKVLDRMDSGKPEVVIVRRHGRQQFKAGLLEHLRLTKEGDPEVNEKLLNWLDRYIDRMMEQSAPQLALPELLNLARNAHFYSVKQGNEDVEHDTFDHLTRAKEVYDKDERDISSFTLLISELANKESNSESWYRKVAGHLKGSHKGQVGLFGGFLGIKGDFFGEKSWEDLDSGERQAVKEAQQKSRDERSMKEQMLKESWSKFAGVIHDFGKRGKDIDIFRISASAVAAGFVCEAWELKPGRDRRVSFVAEVPLAVVKPDEIDDGILSELKTLKKTLAEQQKLLAIVKAQSMLRPTFGKGDYGDFAPNKSYIAPSDGWLLVMSSGPNADRITEVKVDGKTRAFDSTKYHTLTIPIRRGEKWEVESRDDDDKPCPGKGTAVAWLPTVYSPVSPEDK